MTHVFTDFVLNFVFFFPSLRRPLPAPDHPPDRPTFRSFFPLAPNFTLFSLSGVFSLNCGLGLRPWTTQIARLGSLVPQGGPFLVFLFSPHVFFLCRFFFFVPNVFFVPFVIFHVVPHVVFFVPLCFFLVPSAFFILSQQQFASFVPFPLFLGPMVFILVPGPAVCSTHRRVLNTQKQRAVSQT